MARKQVEQKLIVVKSRGTIGELGGISGPVLSPCYVPITVINTLLNHHRQVYEVNPENYSEMVPLSLKNLRKTNFVRKATGNVKPRMAPSINDTAVVRNSNAPSTRVKTFDSNPPVVTKPAPKKTARRVEKVEEAPAVVEPPVNNDRPTSDFTMND